MNKLSAIPIQFNKGNTVGIDLGTTYSTLAQVNDQGEPIPIPNEDDDVETASLILLAESGHVIVGPNRNRAAIEKPENVVERIKRHMGATEFKRTFDGHEITPEFISALILKKLKRDSEQKIGTIANAVITVPYYFNDTRRKATQDAGQIAGLNVIDIINEPTAATLTYAWHRGELGVAHSPDFKKRRVLIYDLGGGTFDATLVEYTPTHFHVLATDGDVELGGVDWNDRILNYICDEFKDKHSIDPRESAQMIQVLRNDCDLAKMELTQRSDVVIPFRYEGKAVTIRLTRAKFDELTADLLQRTIDTTDFVLEQTQLKYSDLDAVVLIGGSTLMPQVRERIKEHTGIAPYIHPDLDPHTAVARGAAIHAAILEARYHAGDSRFGDRIKKLLVGIRQEDVNSHGLGIVAMDPRTKKAINHIMIPRNTTLPFEVTQTFQTNKENQTRVSVQVLEGDAPDPIACSLLGKCTITNLPEHLKKGSPVDVTYSFDKNGRIAVNAKEKTSGQAAVIEVERRGTLTDQQVNSFTQLASEYTVE
ncbi:MAG: Hsp70 family protein [Planctomycetaceae bacterium]|jgi:molecular chaperone DnaK|nr:Hsp70 family protein [Planctomycetaceae bacterium]